MIAASGAPADQVRRAAMLLGDLGTAARLALHGTPEELMAVDLTIFRPVLLMLAALGGGRGRRAGQDGLPPPSSTSSMEHGSRCIDGVTRSASSRGT
ncbi:MAG: hypothetical protein R2705_08160 [Ilumatobacteraceae bacterium]